MSKNKFIKCLCSVMVASFMVVVPVSSSHAEVSTPSLTEKDGRRLPVDINEKAKVKNDAKKGKTATKTRTKNNPSTTPTTPPPSSLPNENDPVKLDSKKTLTTYTMRDTNGKLTKTPRKISSGEDVQNHPMFSYELNGCRNATASGSKFVGLTVRLLRGENWAWGNTDCFYAKPVKNVLQCVSKMQITGSSPTNPSYNPKVKTTTSTWGKKKDKDRTEADCRESEKLNIKWSGGESSLGRFIFTTQTHIDITTFITEKDPSIVGGTTTTYRDKSADTSMNIVNSKTYLQQHCSDKYTNVGKNRDSVFKDNPQGEPWTFTASDCPDGDPERDHTEDRDNAMYKCVYDGKNSVAGKETNTATIFRSGEYTPLKFQKMSIKANNNKNGLGLKKVTGTKTKILRSGTPWNVNGKLPANANNFVLKYGNKNKLSNNQGTAYLDDNLNGTWEASANWASKDSNPTTLQKKIQVSAQFTFKLIVITSISQDGNATYHYDISKVNTTADCSGKPITLNYVRGITTN